MAKQREPKVKVREAVKGNLGRNRDIIKETIEHIGTPGPKDAPVPLDRFQVDGVLADMRDALRKAIADTRRQFGGE